MSSIFAGEPGRDRHRFVSHRGYPPLAPENSLPGFAYAGLLGQWAIETDVHLTRDGVLVCCHDATVDAMYDGTGAIADMTWAELARLRLNVGSRLECFDEDQLRIPLLSEYLQICRSFGSVPFIELKVPEPERVLRAATDAGLSEEQLVMSSAHLPWLEEARGVAPHVYLHHNFSDDLAMARLADLGNAGVSWKISDPDDLPPHAVPQAHAMGLRVCLRAADNAKTVAQMQVLGLDYLPTNTMHNTFSPAKRTEGSQ